MAEVKITIDEVKKQTDQIKHKIDFDRFSIFFPAEKKHMMILNSKHLIIIVWKDEKEKIHHYTVAKNDDQKETLQIKKISFEGSQIEITYCGLIGNYKVSWKKIIYINIA